MTNDGMERFKCSVLQMIVFFSSQLGVQLMLCFGFSVAFRAGNKQKHSLMKANFHHADLLYYTFLGKLYLLRCSQVLSRLSILTYSISSLCKLALEDKI